MPLTDEQMIQRQRIIGGSDAPIIVLKEKYPFGGDMREDLYRRKLGIAAPVKETSAMKRGKYMEPIVAQIFQEETGLQLAEEKNTLHHPMFPYIGGNVDRLVYDNFRGPGVVEIKVPGIRQFARIKREGVHDYYQIQHQHYMGLGYKWGILIVFNAEMWEMIHFEMEQDQELVNLIYNEEALFWDHVTNQIPPPKNTSPVVELPPEKGDIIKVDSKEWIDAVTELKTAKEILEEAEELKNMSESKIKEIMELNNISVGEGGGARIYYKYNKGRKSFDKDALAKDYPEINLDRYNKVSEPSKVFKSYFIGGIQE